MLKERKPYLKFVKISPSDSHRLMEFPNKKVVVKTDAEGLDTVLQDFEDFLRGCGFIFKGHLEIVKDDNNEQD